MKTLKNTVTRDKQHAAVQSKTKQQASKDSILQTYKAKTTQLQSAEDEEPVQGKFKTTQLAAEVIQNHSKQCGCASCTGTKQPIQKKGKSSAETIVQLKPCAECGKEKGHLSGCSRHKHNRSTTGRGTHKLGGSHDDGSGYQRSGAGGDRHEKGRRAAQKAQERKQGKGK